MTEHHHSNSGRAKQDQQRLCGSCKEICAYDPIIGIDGDIVGQATEGSPLNQCDILGDEDKSTVRLWDISGEKPRKIALDESEKLPDAHMLTVLPGEHLVYLSGPPPLKIIDISDPHNPSTTCAHFANAPLTDQNCPTMTNLSTLPPTAENCHEVGLDLARNRAFCAAVTEVQIWDISDRHTPVVISVIRNPLIMHHHSAEVTPDGNILVVSDENLSIVAGAPIACTDENAPTGALWFYDIRNVQKPKELGCWVPPDPLVRTQAMCTAHNYSFFPGRQWLAVAWYAHGLFVLNYSDVLLKTKLPPANVKMVAHHSPSAPPRTGAPGAIRRLVPQAGRDLLRHLGPSAPAALARPQFLDIGCPPGHDHNSQNPIRSPDGHARVCGVRWIKSSLA